VLLAIEKQGIKLLWHELAHERQAVRCLILDHFTPGANRSDANGTYQELSDFIFYVFIYMYLWFI
jgi:hypothetical protein